jgi:polyisoprenyl-phosphate glycosyltransferase
MELISIVTPCFNEEDTIIELCDKIQSVFATIKGYDYEHVIIDNFSTDKTRAILRLLAEKNSKIKVIFNSRNFGYIRSVHHAILQTAGNSVVIMAADLQDPPELLPTFIEKRNEGYHSILAVKRSSKENQFKFLLRKTYYKVVKTLSDEVPMVENFFGFGLFDRKVIDHLKQIEDPYPYLRGIISEVGMMQAIVKYDQPVRKKGKTKFDFYRLFDFAMIALTNYSKIPIRLISLAGILLAASGLILGALTFIMKIFNWSFFSTGMAALMIVSFCFMGINFLVLGIIGEYILSINTKVSRRPYVFEMERINIDSDSKKEPK